MNNEPSVSTMHNETNSRIYDRNIPSQVLQPYIDTRPVMTKYSHLPIVDPRKKPTVPLMQMPNYNQHHTFNPGNSAPCSGFQVNVESELRSQVFALQKCSQATYVPSSRSDMYQVNLGQYNQPVAHNLLFQEEHFGNFNPNPNSKFVGTGIFNNSTRWQMQDMNEK
jgi:hypothetical protein